MNITPDAPLKNGKIAKKNLYCLDKPISPKTAKVHNSFEFLEYKKALSYGVWFLYLKNRASWGWLKPKKSEQI